MIETVPTTIEDDAPHPGPDLLGARVRRLASSRFVDPLVGLACFGASVAHWELGVRASMTPPSWFETVLLAAATIPFALRRRAPIPVLTVLVVAAALLDAIGVGPYAVDVTVAVAMFSVAARFDRGPATITLVAAEVALAIGAGVGLLVARPGRDAYVVHTMLAVGTLWFAGVTVRTGHGFAVAVAERAEQRRIATAEQQRAAVRSERMVIARELHDVVAHSLTVMTVQAGVAARGRHDAEARRALESIEQTGRVAQEELRVVLAVLRDGDTAPAPSAPSPSLRDLDALVAQVAATGVAVDLVRTGGTSTSPAVDLTVYRIVQEALTNVVRHAPGADVRGEVAVRPDAVRLSVEDTVPAAHPRGPARATEDVPRHGLIGMRERVAAFGGSLIAEPIPGVGFRIAATIPTSASAR